MKKIVELQAVTKNYGSRKALHNINLNLEAGKIIGLLGSNGSGKSTLMKLAAGLIQPTSGTIRICGEPIGIGTKAVTSFMPDQPVTESWMRVKDALRFFSDFYKDFDQEKAGSMLDFLKLDRNDRISSLSKGMNERLQLTLAMSRQAKLYLLDEPIGGVDPVARGKILDAIVKFYNEDSCVLISTHLITDIERIFDEVLFIQNGEVSLRQDVESIRSKHGKSVDELFREVFSE
ncbi:ABC-2 type transport system ATP-binding protein [Paenibacillus algorifonticola]|uniref:ABC-2 type transport system ATP-binding protein n=1 Tax=Paenibacillus algorifonticola TaxID=684063 RepID=A0A1I1XUV2_9BACL|nr:ABC transporter ATP-binding protein [Paenibacillus algorifonticola]SFE09330.1 ABC-2 type transport system ATP-binding protein [Paenibacillus algorifonticola]